MKITVDTNAVLALLGQDGEHWIQDSWEEGDSMCLHGAIRRCQPQPGDAYLIQQVAGRQGWGTFFNDAAEGWDEVKDRILQGLEVTDEDLADTYGPNWRYVVTLVRQAASLTEKQAFDARAAWHAAWRAVKGASCVSARGIAGGVASDTARDAAGDAAGDAARDVAGYVAEDAARALVVRDLITSEQYQTLAGPWESVMGPIKECCDE